MLAVDNVECAQIFDCIKPFCFQLGKFRLFAHRAQHRNMAVACSLVFFAEIVEYVAESQTVAAYFVGICRADAFTGGADFSSTFGPFVGRVKQAVGGEYEVDFFR